MTQTHSHPPAMPTDPAFRLSLYLTLALACASLGYSESTLFPIVGVFAGVAVIAFAVVYRLENRVPLLTIAAANKVGGGIAVVALIWAGTEIGQELWVGEFTHISWPAFLVVLCAPILMAAIPVKLLRQEKATGDYWFLYAASLGAVALSVAITEAGLTFGLALAYALCGSWSLYRFYLARSHAAAAPASGTETASGPRPGAGFSRSFVWCMWALVLALPVYLVTPRSESPKMVFGQPRVEIGYAADQMIDLNVTGELASVAEVAFEVTATEDDGRPKENLSGEQRWVGTVLTVYSAGHWRREPGSKLPQISQTVVRRELGAPKEAWVPPKFGPERYRLQFTVPPKLRAVFLADPVVWDSTQPAPIADIPPGGPPQPWYALPDGSFGSLLRMSDSPRRAAAPLPYVQYTRPLSEPDLSPAFKVEGSIDRELMTTSLVSVKEYANEVIERAVREKRLSPDVLVRDQMTNRPRAVYHEAIAREFTRHLSGPAGLTYTTNIPRSDRKLDPVEDFLFHTKAGHCERFATALILMLRSQGIPSVLVLGFKGADNLGGGRYEVHQEQAHAWAAALISRPTGPPGKNVLWHWLALDPSPEVAATNTGASTGGPVRTLSIESLKLMFNKYVVQYTNNERDRVLGRVIEGMKSGYVVAVGGFVVAILLGVLAFRRRSHLSPVVAEPAQWFGRLLAVLATRGFVPGPADTQREFAQTVAVALRGQSATRPVAEVPLHWAEAYYEIRFGGYELPADRQASLDVGLAALQLALAGKRRGP